MKIKHLYYLSYNQFIKYGSLDKIKTSILEGCGLNEGDENTNRLIKAVNSVVEHNFINAPTLYTSLEDFVSALAYVFEKNAIELYFLSKELATLEIEKRIYQNGGHTTTGSRDSTGTTNETSEGTTTSESTNKTEGSATSEHATTPTTLKASEYTDERTSDKTSGTGENTTTTKNNAKTQGNSTNGENYSDETIYKINFSDLLNNIERLNDKLYNKIEQVISKCMYNLLYDIE